MLFPGEDVRTHRNVFNLWRLRWCFSSDSSGGSGGSDILRDETLDCTVTEGIAGDRNLKFDVAGRHGSL
jgi:hypothetical protein